MKRMKRMERMERMKREVAGIESRCVPRRATTASHRKYSVIVSFEALELKFVPMCGIAKGDLFKTRLSYFW